MKNFLVRLLSAVLATVLLGLILSSMTYTPVSQRSAHTLYESFLGLFIIYSVYSAPVFLVGGILFSTVADVITKKIQFSSIIKTYIVSFLMYSIGGIVVNFFFYMMLADFGWGTDAFYMLVIGVAGALLFLHIKLLLSYFIGFNQRKANM